MSARALPLLAALAACGAEIVEQPSDDTTADTTTSSSTSATTSTGAGGSGAAGAGSGASVAGAGGAGTGSAATSAAGGGGGTQGVVGCEKLVLHPQQVVIPDGSIGHLLPLDGQDLAVVYRASTGVPGGWDTRSRRMLAPFSAWPPPIADALTHGTPHSASFQSRPHARSDGAFVHRRFEGWSIGSFYDAAVDVRAPEGQAGAYPILEPSPGTGVYWSYGVDLAYYPTIDAAAPSFTDWLPNGTHERAHGVAFDPAALLLQAGADLVVNDGDWTAVAAPTSLSLHGQIIHRPGGFYWRQPVGGFAPVTLYPYAATEPLPPIELSDAGLYGYQVDAASWRDGAVVANISGDDGGNGWLEVTVTDEVHTTSALQSTTEFAICANGVSVAASPDGDSVYVGYLWCPYEGHAYVVRRFDCVSE